MSMWCSKPTQPFKVTVHIDGRHPYLEGHELDKETRDVVLTVPAYDWNNAGAQALKAVLAFPGYRFSVMSIEVVN